VRFMTWLGWYIPKLYEWGWVPRGDVKGHKATFLFANADQRCMNILQPACTDGEFEHLVDKCKKNGADTLYLFLINEGDGPWTPASFYHGDIIGGDINSGVRDKMQKRCRYARKKGFKLVFWLRADDSPTFNRTPMGRQLRYQDHACKYFVEPYGCAVVVGLELDEYANAASVEQWAADLRQRVKVPVGTHQTGDRYSFAQLPSVDDCWFQYGFGKSPEHIEARTAAVKAALGGRRIYAAEYDKSSETEGAKNRGDAAMRGGASGTGNGRH